MEPEGDQKEVERRFSGKRYSLEGWVESAESVKEARIAPVKESWIVEKA